MTSSAVAADSLASTLSTSPEELEATPTSSASRRCDEEDVDAYLNEVA